MLDLGIWNFWPLKANWVSRFESGWTTGRALPARRPAIVETVIWRSVEAKARDDCEGVPIARINRDPFTGAALSKATKVRGTHRRFDQTCASEHVRDGAGAIIGVVMKGVVASAETVGLGTELVGRPNRSFHGKRSVFRRRSLSVSEMRGLAGHGRSG